MMSKALKEEKVLMAGFLFHTVMKVECTSCKQPIGEFFYSVGYEVYRAMHQHKRTKCKDKIVFVEGVEKK